MDAVSAINKITAEISETTLLGFRCPKAAISVCFIEYPQSN